MNTCPICNQWIGCGMTLSNGMLVHDGCILVAIKKKSELEKCFEAINIRSQILQREILRRQSIEFKIVSIFRQPEKDSALLRKELSDSMQSATRIESELQNMRDLLKRVYDYYPSYPPDWGDRKIQVIIRDGDACGSCGTTALLHLHHRVPLSKGGTNKVENLVLLCEKCHSEVHGGRLFRDEQARTETAFSKRIIDIQKAIQGQKRMTFGYKKPLDASHQQRYIRPPYRLENIKHHRDDGTTLCLVGFCETRKAERVFALKRMRGLRVL